jgi:hypothetical protein
VTNAKLTFDGSLLVSGAFAPPAVTGADVATALSRQRAFPRLALTTGTGAGKVSKVVWTVRTLAASASDTLDLFAGSALTDPFGAVVTFTVVRFVMVAQVANPDATADGSGLSVGGAASNAVGLFADASDIYVVRGVSALPLLVGDPTGLTIDGTHKNLKVLNNDGALSSSYLLALAGE